MPISGNSVHVLSDIDVASRSGTCAHCGPVSLAPASRGTFRCAVVKRAELVRRDFLRRLRKYGITEADWHAMLIAQSGRCAICRDPMDSPAIDHNHDTGAVRGLLCRPCNLTIGHALESPSRLRSAADYLERD